MEAARAMSAQSTMWGQLNSQKVGTLFDGVVMTIVDSV